jgi:hypothetical protein
MPSWMPSTMNGKSLIDLEGLRHYHKRDNLTHHIYTKLGGPVDNQKMGHPLHSSERLHPLAGAMKCMTIGY